MVPILSDFLYPIVWEAIEVCELDADLKCLFLCCDGASPNRKFFQLHSPDNSIIHSIQNPFASDDRKIYFISDPPHLIKTTRNTLANSYSHRKTRKLWNNGQDISWMHIVKLFEEHCEGVDSLVTKLTRQHVDLTSFSQMNVNLAAQVLSDSVAHALRFNYGDRFRETAKLCEMMNKWFDLMNTRNLQEGIWNRNPNLEPYKSVNDPRLVWLETTFLKYLDDWELSVSNRRGNFSKKQLNQMQLSKPTLTGLRMTTKSIVACIKLLLNENAPFVLISHFQQDCLEQHFGHYRSKGGCNNNPSVFEALHICNQVRSVNSQALAPERGNVLRQFEHVDVSDTTRVPRKKQKRH